MDWHHSAAVSVGVLVVSTALAGDRWYSPRQVSLGKTLFVTHCAICHGSDGEGQPNWQERDPATGFYPAPPLNSSGHAFHHPMQQMLTTLDQGGGPRGGFMPSFVDELSDADKKAVIAYVQSLWPDDIYRTWQDIDRGVADASGTAGGEHRD